MKLETKLKKYNVEFRLYDFDVNTVITSRFPIKQKVYAIPAMDKTKWISPYSSLDKNVGSKNHKTDEMAVAIISVDPIETIPLFPLNWFLFYPIFLS